MKGGEDMPRKKKDEFVKIARAGGKVQEVYPNGSGGIWTIDNALEAAGIQPKASEELRLNGKSAELDDKIKAGDRVTLVRQVAGGK